MAREFDEILNECLEGMLHGETVEQCLQRYPGQAAELEPLLRVAAVAGRATSAVEPRPEFKARVRYEVRSRLSSREQNTAAKKSSLVRWVPRWAMAAVCIALVLVLAGSGTVAAASDSVPGDTLYSVKTAAEQVHMKLTFSEAAKARLQARFAERRVWEMAQLAKRGRTESMQTLSSKFELHLAKIEQLAAQIEQADPQKEQVSRLRQVLDRNMARDLAVLDAAEARAPVRSRSAVAVARFRLMQQYDEAIGALNELEGQRETSSGPSGATEGGSPPGGSGSESSGAGAVGDGSSDSGGYQGDGSQVHASEPNIPQLGYRCARPS